VKFYSIVSGISYEVIAADYEYNGPNLRNRKLVPGITARFSNHMYDTKEAQKVNKWSDETREMVEYYLLNHENFNTQWLQTVPESEAESKAKEFTETGTCISRTVTDEGIVDCDQPAEEGEFYCKRHMSAMEPVKN
jgi:hypothetical protein